MLNMKSKLATGTWLLNFSYLIFVKFGNNGIRQPKFIGSHLDTFFVIHPFLSCFFNNKKYGLKNENSLVIKITAPLTAVW